MEKYLTNTMLFVPCINSDFHKAQKKNHNACFNIVVKNKKLQKTQYRTRSVCVFVLTGRGATLVKHIMLSTAT